MANLDWTPRGLPLEPMSPQPIKASYTDGTTVYVIVCGSFDSAAKHLSVSPGSYLAPAKPYHALFPI